MKNNSSPQDEGSTGQFNTDVPTGQFNPRVPLDTSNVTISDANGVVRDNKGNVVPPAPPNHVGRVQLSDFTAPLTPEHSAATYGNQGWLASKLDGKGFSSDEIRGILAMNANEGGDVDSRSLLGFKENQAFGDITATGPEGHLNAFMKQWTDMSRRPNGQIPGVNSLGQVNDWTNYMTWIREKIVGQTGVQKDFNGEQQPPSEDYQKRLMKNLWWLPPKASSPEDALAPPDTSLVGVVRRSPAPPDLAGGFAQALPMLAPLLQLIPGGSGLGQVAHSAANVLGSMRPGQRDENVNSGSGVSGPGTSIYVDASNMMDPAFVGQQVARYTQPGATPQSPQPPSELVSPTFV